MSDDTDHRKHGSTIRPSPQLMRLHPDQLEGRPNGATAPVDEPEPTAEVEMGEAVVAHGHVVHVPVPGAARTKCGWDVVDRRDVTRVRCDIFRPGEKVRLPVDEIRRLQGLGYLVDPSRTLPPRAPTKRSPGPDIAA